MRLLRLAAILISVLSLSSVVQVATAGFDPDIPDPSVPDITTWLDSRPSDPPLTDGDVVHRPELDLPDFVKSWILVVDGEREAPGVCGYSFGFEEPADVATPKMWMTTAVDPSSCEVEFTVGIPDVVQPPNAEGLEYDLSESGSGAGEASTNNTFEGQILAYMNPDAVSGLNDSSSYYPLPQIRYTVYGEWTDFLPGPGLVVNQVLSAAKAKVDNRDRLSRHACRHDRSRRASTGWQDRSTGSTWGYEDCREGRYEVKSSTSARFMNPDFPLCQATDPAWVYYDRLSARAATTTLRGTFQYNIVSTWTAGCRETLRWAGFHTYPGEYNTTWKARRSG